MQILNKTFILIFLFLFSIPFISCNNNSTEPGEQSIPEGSKWVYIPTVNGKWKCDEIKAEKYFKLHAESACKTQGLKYLGKTRCVTYGNGTGIEVLCGK